MFANYVIANVPKLEPNSNKANPTKGATKMNTLYRTANDNVYPIWQGTDGRYFIVDKNGKVSYFSNPTALKLIEKNELRTLSKDTYEEMYKKDEEQRKAEETILDLVNQKPQSVPVYNVTYSAPKVDTSAKDERIAELEKKLEGYLKVWSAPELAELYGIDYNEANILKDYNDATNKYYDDIVAEQNKLRTQYVRNNAQYLNQITDSYLDSYKNAAPTAVGKGTLAANALSTQLAAGQTNAYNDYGMLQNVNNLEKTRQAELVSNANEAKQYYNRLGTMLSTLGANKNVSDVAQYVATLDKYSSDYAADRAYATYLAQENAAKYTGLANAAQTNAASSANTDTWNQIYNWYKTYHGGTAAADSNIANLLKKSASS